MHLITIVCLVIINSNLILTYKTDTFTEELLLKPLYSEQLYAHFQFTTKWDTEITSQSFYHSHLFPRALGELIERYNVQELHVSLTGGLWRYETWGYPVMDAAPGAEVWVWFKSSTVNVDQNWKQLCSALSGLLCASLNFVDSLNSARPEFSFQPKGALDEPVNNTFVRYSALPQEIVCTENLTPWKKLLPCGSKVGLASLLNSGYIHNSRYHSIGLHVRPVCRTKTNCEQRSLELQQMISIVYDYQLLATKNWSFRKLFGQGLMGNCPLATNSAIFIDITGNASIPFQLIPAPDDYITSIRGGFVNEFAKYNVKNYAMSINANYLGKSMVLVNSPPAIYANQYLTGYGHEKGGIVVNVYNNHWSELSIVVLQVIPWYVPVYLHSLKVQIGNNYVEPLILKFIPGKARNKPYYIETVVKLPARAACKLSIDFDYVFLKWQEYPPDANHGFYINSAVVSAYLPLARNFTGLPQDGGTISDSFNASRSGYLVQVRTENMVITLPTPDFSMPYNVICLACTVVALAFGPLHNITTKRLVLKPKDNERLVVKLKRKLLKCLKCLGI